MPDIQTLLRDAVPLDRGEPDFATMARRVSARRRRRWWGRGLAGLLVVGLGAAAAVAVTDPNPDQDSDWVATDGAVDRPDASELVHLMGTRGWLATTRFAHWPVAPDDFFAPGVEPDLVVYGTLNDVRSGETIEQLCVDDPAIGGCIDNATVETVIRVEGVVGDGVEAGDLLAVPWVTGPLGSGPDAELTNALTALSFQAVAPLGARVLVFLEHSDGDGYPWRPIEPSGIVFEHHDDDTLVPHPDASVSHQPYSLDDYLQAAETHLDG